MGIEFDESEILYLKERILNLSQALLGIAQDIDRVQQGETLTVPGNQVSQILAQIDGLSFDQLDQVSYYILKRLRALQQQSESAT